MLLRHYVFVCLALSSALQEKRQTRFLVRSLTSDWCQSCSLSNLPSGKPMTTKQWRIPLFVLWYSSVDCVLTPGLCECTCVFKRDWHSILRLLKYFLWLACKPRRGRKHKTSPYVHTHTPCIKSMSVKSRRVLRLPPLDLQKWGVGEVLNVSVVGYTLVFHCIIHSTKTTRTPP